MTRGTRLSPHRGHWHLPLPWCKYLELETRLELEEQGEEDHVVQEAPVAPSTAPSQPLEHPHGDSLDKTLSVLTQESDSIREEPSYVHSPSPPGGSETRSSVLITRPEHRAGRGALWKGLAKWSPFPSQWPDLDNEQNSSSQSFSIGSPGVARSPTHRRCTIPHYGRNKRKHWTSVYNELILATG